MKTFCPNCEKETECDFTAELYECNECGEDFASYIKPRFKEQNNQIENLKKSQEHVSSSQAVKHMLELTSFLRKILMLSLLRGNPMLRNEALKILDDVESLDFDVSIAQDIHDSQKCTKPADPSLEEDV